MTFQTKSIIGCILAGLLLLIPGHSAPITEDYILENIASEGGDIAIIKEINAMPVKEREYAVRLALTLMDKLYKERNSRACHPKLNRLVPIFPSLGLPNEVATHLAPMIDCEDPEIQSNAFRALARLDHDAGVHIVVARMEHLFSKFPNSLNAFSSKEEANAQLFLNGLEGLLEARSGEKRALGLKFVKRLKQKYAGGPGGKEFIAQFNREFERFGISSDSVSVKENAPKAEPRTPEALPKDPQKAGELIQKSAPVPDPIQ